ncbi:MAG: hypothetical protein U0Q07_09295 [Acidimicrobiales bacterium]
MATTGEGAGAAAGSTPSPAATRTFDRRVDLALVGLAVLAGAIYLAIGPGLLMDDWWSLRNVAFGGPVDAAGSNQWLARPATGAIYAFVFGVVGPHPAVGVAILGALQAVSAVLFHRLLRAFVSPALAATAAVVWLLLPNHTSLEVWMSATNIAVSQVAVLVGALVLARARAGIGWSLLAGATFALAVLSYEAAAPMALAVAVAVPWLRRRSLPVALVAAAALPVVLAGAWAWIHVNPAKRVSTTLVDLSPVLPANLGWGVAPGGILAELLYVIGMVVIVAAAARLAVPAWRCWSGEEDWAVVAGVAVMVLGALPFVRYAFEPLGGGDRENYLAAFGGALVWAGGLRMLTRWSPRLWVAGLVGLAVLALPVRWQRWQLWHTAGQDAAAMTREIADRGQATGRPVVVGPGPIVISNITAFDGSMNMEAGVQYAGSDPSLRIVLVDSEGALLAAPPEDRVDLRTVSRLDDQADPSDP